MQSKTLESLKVKPNFKGFSVVKNFEFEQMVKITSI